MEIQNHFDKLLLFDGCELAPPIIKGNELIIQVQNAIILPGHPLNDGAKELKLTKAALKFSGVTKSERLVCEYVETPFVNKFKPPYTINDGPFASMPKHTLNQVFTFEGILLLPLAYVGWIIEAASFSLITI